MRPSIPGAVFNKREAGHVYTIHSLFFAEATAVV
jgi:hypothetical protein